MQVRIVLSKGQQKITCPQYTFEAILGPLFVGVVYGASLTCCAEAPYGVIRRWQRVLCISSIHTLLPVSANKQNIANNPFFEVFLEVNIPTYSDTFLSEHQLQALLGHYLCDCFTAPI